MLYNTPSYSTMQRAISCDPVALLRFVQFYNAYIDRLSKRPVLGSDGMIYLRTDEDIKQELVLELLTKIPRFQIPDIQEAKEKQP